MAPCAEVLTFITAAGYGKHRDGRGAGQRARVPATRARSRLGELKDSPILPVTRWGPFSRSKNKKKKTIQIWHASQGRGYTKGTYSIIRPREVQHGSV